MIASASVLHMAHPTDMTARQAAEALRPVVGDLGPVLFSIGIIGSGLVAIPVLVASMCYDLAQAMGWRYGLSEHPWDAKSFYLLISAAMLVAGLLNFIHMNPVKALYWSMILAGILTIPIFLFILIISNDRRVMRTTKRVCRTSGWARLRAERPQRPSFICGCRCSEADESGNRGNGNRVI